MQEAFRRFLNEDQDPAAVEKVYNRIIDLLTTEEEILYIAVQKKPAINISPNSIVLTNRRVILCRPRNLGLSMDFQDFLWRDVADCHMKENILGAEFSVQPLQGAVETIDYLPKIQARKLYQIAQEMEEQQIDFRRNLELEERRAGAGQFVVGQGTAGASGSTPEDPVQVLQQLKRLLDNGLISQQEYDAKKAEILNRL